PEQITIGRTSDFAAPMLVPATRRLSALEATAATIPVAAFVRDDWSALQQKLGTNNPKCILVCENLNDPNAVETVMNDLARDIPCAGVSHLFRFDLPFEQRQLEMLAKDKRGVSLLAVCCGVEAQLEILSGLPTIQTPGEEDLATQEGQAKWRQV